MTEQYTIVLTMQELLNLYPHLTEFCNTGLVGKLRYPTGKLFSKVTVEKKRYDEINREIVQRLGHQVTLEEATAEAVALAGRPLTETEMATVNRVVNQQSWKVSIEDIDAYNEEIKPTLESEVVLTGVIKIKGSLIDELPDSIPIKPLTIANLGPVMED